MGQNCSVLYLSENRSAMSLSPLTPSIMQADFLLRPFIRLTSDHQSLDLFEIKASAIF